MLALGLDCAYAKHIDGYIHLHRKLSATVHDFLEQSCTIAESLRSIGNVELAMGNEI